MPLIASATSSAQRQLVSEGVHVARCYMVADLGTHDDTYQGKARKRRTVRIAWEIPGETIEIDGQPKPLGIAQTYTLSLGEKSSLRKDLEAWRGRKFTDEELAGFDVAKLLGAPCMLQVVHSPRRDGQGNYADISSIMALPKGTPVPAAVNKPVFYNASEHEEAAFQALPEFIRDTIRESDEWKAHMRAAATPAEKEVPTSEDVPF